MLTTIIQIMNGILDDYTEHECLNLIYLQSFHISIQNRVEFIYKTFQELERFETYRDVIMMQKVTTHGGLLSLFGFFNDSANENHTIDLLKMIDMLLRNIPY